MRLAAQREAVWSAPLQRRFRLVSPGLSPPRKQNESGDESPHSKLATVCVRFGLVWSAWFFPQPLLHGREGEGPGKIRSRGMRPFRSILFSLLVLAAPGCRPANRQADRVPGWELRTPAPGAVPVAAGQKLSGIYPVGSRIKDPKALGGFGPCDNFPKDLGDREWGNKA